MVRLTKKENDFAKEYAKTGNGTRSALKVYNTKSENTAAVIANENLRKPKIQDRIKSIADQIPDSLLVKKHLELLTVPRKVRTFIKGDLTNEYEEVDSFAISKGLDMAYKMKGTYAPEKVAHTGQILLGQMDKLSNDQLNRIAEGGTD